MSASAKATGRKPVSRGRQSTVAGGGGSLSLASTKRVHLTFVRARLIRREISNLSVPSGIISATATTAFNGYRSAPSDVARLRMAYARRDTLDDVVRRSTHKERRWIFRIRTHTP